MSCKDCTHFYEDDGRYQCAIYPDSALDTNLTECVAINRKFKEVGIKSKPVPITRNTIQKRLEAI